ncbi:MAG TPA: DUF5856 family protein [Bacteroidales bacterium]|nr:DUF5856 family protein [Bacteroidales bacterium]
MRPNIDTSKLKSPSAKNKGGHFVTYMLQSAVQAHVLHLVTKSYAQHKALEDYYEAISDMIDGVAETIQGKFGILSDYACDCKIDQNLNPITYFTECLNYVNKERTSLPQDSYLQNQIDEIVALLEGTIYKLKFLA